MTPLPLYTALLLGLLLPTGLSAQTIEELVSRNLEAKGGAALLKQTDTVRTSARATQQGREVTIVTITKRPSFFRQEITLNQAQGQQGAPQKIVQAFDGQTVWMSMGGMPAQALPPGPQTDAMKRTSHIDSPLLDYKEKGTRVERGEPLTEEGRTLHHLIVTPSNAPAMHYYIDPATFLEAKMVIDVEDRDQKSRMEMRFSDFRKVDGRTVPFAVDQFVNGSKMGEVRFDKIEFNVPVDDAVFRMPR